MYMYKYIYIYIHSTYAGYTIDTKEKTDCFTYLFRFIDPYRFQSTRFLGDVIILTS